MAFRYSNFKQLTYNYPTSPAMWSYETTDSLSLVTSENYFNDERVAQKVTPGDNILCNANGQSTILAFSDSKTASTPLTASQPLSTVYVNSDSDWPTPIGGIVELAEDTEYVIRSGYSTGYRFECAPGVKIRGTSETAAPIGLTASGGSIFNCDDLTMTFESLALSSPNARLLSAVAPSTLTTQYVGIRKCNFMNCQDVAYFENTSSILEFVVCVGFDTAFEYLGSGITGAIVNTVRTVDMSPAARHYVFNDTTFNHLTLYDVVQIGQGTGFTSSNGGANIISGSVGQVIRCKFGINDASTLTPLDGFDDGVNTIGWSFEDTYPQAQIDNTLTAADAYLLDLNVISATAGVWHEIGIPSVGSWQTDLTNRYTLNPDGSLTYNGDETIVVDIPYQTAVEKTGGGSDRINCRVALNWAGDPDSGIAKSENFTDQNTPAGFSGLADHVTLNTGDNIRLIYQNQDSNANIQVYLSKFSINKVAG